MNDPSIIEHPGSIYLRDQGRGYLLHDPVEIIGARSAEEVVPALEKADERSQNGFYVAGYVAYEAGLALQPKNITPKPSKLPLIWLGVYPADHVREAAFPETGTAEDAPAEPVPSIAKERYFSDLERIQGYIAAGDIYQCNHTFKLKWKLTVPLARRFHDVLKPHPVGYPAFLNCGSFQVASFSPELFLRREGRRLLARPMKGTAPRGLWWEEDRQKRRALRSDPKERAENIMIVDLMRNDLGRICETGTVKAPRLFRVEKYPSLHQMVSDVTGVLREGAGLADIFRAAFPSGSVTGAPKLRAMQVIQESEQEPRDVYCGTIGLVRPGGDFQFNVAIRTVVQEGGRCEMGIGSGVVADSEPEAEWKECLLKSGFLGCRSVRWDLLESLLHDEKKGYAFLEEHLRRMRKSARYFSLPWDGDAVRRSLKAAAVGKAKVRILLNAEGLLRTESTPIEPEVDGLVRLWLSEHRVDPSDPFLYHKTTRRGCYDGDLREAQIRGYYDVLYMNESGELTEGARTNIIVESGGERFTPAIACGLLPGVWRDVQIKGGVRERALTMEGLPQASRVWVGNSVRDDREVGVIETRDPASGGIAVVWKNPTHDVVSAPPAVPTP